MRLRLSSVPVLVAVAAMLSLLALRVAGAPDGALAIQAGAFVLAALFAAPGRVADFFLTVDARWASGAVLLIACALPFAGVEIDGARRWLRLGPVLIHPASLLGSVLLLMLARAPGSLPCAVLAGAAVLCFGLGHDGAASLAFALGLGGLLLAERTHWKTLLPLCVPAWCLAAWKWSRPDNLAPAPSVEEIIARTLAASTPLGAAAHRLGTGPAPGQQPLALTRSTSRPNRGRRRVPMTFPANANTSHSQPCRLPEMMPLK